MRGSYISTLLTSKCPSRHLNAASMWILSMLLQEKTLLALYCWTRTSWNRWWTAVPDPYHMVSFLVLLLNQLNYTSGRARTARNTSTCEQRVSWLRRRSHSRLSLLSSSTWKMWRYLPWLASARRLLGSREPCYRTQYQTGFVATAHFLVVQAKLLRSTKPSFASGSHIIRDVGKVDREMGQCFLYIWITL